jgi:hypothetical protein
MATVPSRRTDRIVVDRMFMTVSSGLRALPP